jgi:hypothetical protein
MISPLEPGILMTEEDELKNEYIRLQKQLDDLKSGADTSRKLSQDHGLKIRKSRESVSQSHALERRHRKDRVKTK